MSGQQYPFDDTYTSVESESDGTKFNSSIRTRQTSQLPQSRKLSLFSCSSSITIESPTQQYQKQLQIFGQYLLASSEKKRLKLQESMKLYYDQALTNTNFVPIQFLYPKASSSLSFKQKQKPQSEDYLYHFVGAWLISMGYQKKQTKKYVLSKFYHQFKDHPQSIAFCQQFYRAFGQSILEKKDRMVFLTKICKNGWEYFIQEAGRFFKRHISQKNSKSMQFKSLKDKNLQ